MNDTMMQANTACNRDFHEDRLWYVAAQGFNIENPVEYNALIVDYHYRCGHCGRQANRQENLCKPQPLGCCKPVAQANGLE
ncbi:hypothetical protein ACFL6U_19655 [Planctomycetota bacterium]